MTKPRNTNIYPECCGQHAVCERDLLRAAMQQRPDYFDDEELDRFAGRPSDGYTPEEEDEFREVLYTTLEEEVADWLRSLQLRGIALPDSLRDEALLIVNEQRGNTAGTMGNEQFVCKPRAEAELARIMPRRSHESRRSRNEQ